MPCRACSNLRNRLASSSHVKHKTGALGKYATSIPTIATRQEVTVIQTLFPPLGWIRQGLCKKVIKNTSYFTAESLVLSIIPVSFIFYLFSG